MRTFQHHFNWTLVVHNEGNIRRFFITSVAALEEAELLCTGTVVPPQALQQGTYPSA
jgi:hypothetical protein